jgi:hypothetical protein
MGKHLHLLAAALLLCMLPFASLSFCECGLGLEHMGL